MKNNGSKTKKKLSGVRATLLSRYTERLGCWLWTGALDSSGYGSLRVGPKIYSVHRLSWIIFRGPIPEGLQVLHRCDTRRCIRPSHLFLGTSQDNTEDMIEKERQPSKLSKGQVIRIRLLGTRGFRARQIRKYLKLPVGTAQVNRVLRGENWK